MGDVLLNGRKATASEVAAPEPRHEGRPVTDLLLEFSHVRRVAS